MFDRMLTDVGPSGRAVYGRSPAEAVGSNPTRGHGCLSVVTVVCLSGRGLCDGLIIRPEDSYRLWRVVECDHETSYARKLIGIQEQAERSG